MEAPKLTREVELPRQRSNGAAVVLVAAMAMFTAVAASAFVVRVRMHAAEYARRAPVVEGLAAPGADDRQIVEVEVLGGSGGPLAAKDDLGDLDPFHAAIARGDDEAALQAWLDTPEAGPERTVWRNEREAVARSYLALQLDHLADELENGDCAAVSERLSRLSRLLPDRHIPAEMALCTDQGSR